MTKKIRQKYPKTLINLAFLVDPALHYDLKVACAIDGITIAEFGSQAIQNALNQRVSAQNIQRFDNQNNTPAVSARVYGPDEPA